MARLSRPVDVQLLRVQAERGRTGDALLREPKSRLLPDGRLRAEGRGADPAALGAAAAVLPLAHADRAAHGGAAGPGRSNRQAGRADRDCDAAPRAEVPEPFRVDAAA